MQERMAARHAGTRALRARDDGGRGAPLALAGLLLAAVWLGCASDGEGSGPASPGGTGSEPSATEAGSSDGEPGTTDGMGSEGARATSPEARDPDAIGNVPATGPGSPAAAADGDRVAPAPSSGCGTLALLASGEHTLEVGGVERSYVLDLPAQYDGSQPLPLVLAFHGATTSGALFRSAFYGNLLSTMGDAAIVVHPDALGDPTAWNAAVDIPFFDALLAELEATACVDEARVFATGHSSGGFFTNTLGCQRGNVLRAIAPVSGGGPFGGNGCTGEVAVWLAHAENDQTVPFDSGVGSRDRWLAANACSDASVPVEPSPCVEYTGCSDGLPVRWCVYQDGHDWPDFGPEGIWGFFSSF